MNITTLDFETYYSQDYSLSKISTEEYIRSPDFEVIGVAVKRNDEPTQWFSGTHEEVEDFLSRYDFESSALLCHNTMFDGAILSWRFGIQPKVLLDTLCMARAVHGVEVGGSLAALATRYNLGQKGTEVLQAKGMRRKDFSPEDLAQYGRYCINDVELTLALFRKLSAGFPKKELKLIDMTLRMFTEPTLRLDTPLLLEHLHNLEKQKASLLASVDVSKAELMSNPQFAQALVSLGVIPPTKVSLRTGKETFAFAKTDEGLKALQDHEDVRVQALVAARLGTKSTQEETRTQRFLDISRRGRLPVPLKYYAAHTGRWGGTDSVNLQNLPSRGPNAKVLKRAIIPPSGYVLVEADSSQIEARVLAWLAGQQDVLDAFAAKEDVYRKMGAVIYDKPESDITKAERFVAKTAVLGAGYGLGAAKFGEALKAQGVVLPPEEVKRIIQVYRAANDKIVALWRQAQTMLTAFCRGEKAPFGRPGVLEVLHEQRGYRFPSGLTLCYNDLQWVQGQNGLEYSYATRNGRAKIYGGRIVENAVQGLARCVVGEQMLRVAKRYRVVLTVHDSIVCCVPEAEADDAVVYITECMQWCPSWAEGLPVDCEVGVGPNYGDCE